MYLRVLIIMTISSELSNFASSSKILALLPFPGSSHFAAFDQLLTELAKKGHEVTVYSTFPKKQPIKNYLDVNVSKCFPKPDVGEFTPQFMAQFGQPFNCLMLLFHMLPKIEDITNCPEMMNLLNNPSEKFDVMITEIFNSDLFVIYAYKLKIPLIGLIPNTMFPWIAERTGNPDNPSYIPQMLTGYLSDMNFIQRLWNSWAFVIGSVLYKYYSTSNSDEIAKILLGPTTPSVEEMVKNTSLQFIYTHNSINPLRPIVPGVVEIGGAHIKPALPISKNIEKFINESKHGVVYFCMGSLLRGSSFPEEKRNAFLHAFSKIPQRVLWKWEGDELPGKSDNIMTSKWMPQRDILAHPNVKLFISHGGLLGTSEAVYEGVPIIGIPIFGDQRTNIKAIEAAGAGVMLDYNEISKEVVLQKIQTVLNDPNYRENAKKLSDRYRDRPMSPLDTAVYWTEYVIRHKGAPHLRSAAVDMPWYQYLLLDVIAFLLLVFVATLAIIYFSIKFLIRLILKPFTKTQKPSHKKVKNN